MYWDRPYKLIFWNPLTFVLRVYPVELPKQMDSLFCFNFWDHQGPLSLDNCIYLQMTCFPFLGGFCIQQNAKMKGSFSKNFFLIFPLGYSFILLQCTISFILLVCQYTFSCSVSIQSVSYYVRIQLLSPFHAMSVYSQFHTDYNNLCWKTIRTFIMGAAKVYHWI